ncbi:symporter [Bifidobacterium pseudolongum subsp. globosum]|uniref:Symporter n=2 Tax=Bifidobacterium pseudolongum TaxID=1694 RepID=A0A2N3R5K9_9BIFI|nr:symporter [Bifidobacterium pseudolongum subsp. globosum]
MLMILSHHFVLHNGTSLADLPMTPTREILSFFFLGAGKIGVAIFFSISTWFLISSEQSIKHNFKRIWLMERELLFWSLTLLVAFAIAKKSLLSPTRMLNSVFPIITNLWWYASAYALFLVILPFLQYALLAMGPKLHTKLALILLLVFGPLSLVPYPTIFSIYLTNVAGFIYVFILLSCYKLYLKQCNVKQLWMFIAGGLLIGIVITALKNASIILMFADNTPAKLVTYTPFRDFSALPSLMVGIPIFLLFDRLHFYNKYINFIAKSAFAVYLISEYPPMRNLLWITLFNLKDIYGKPFALLRIVVILLGVYVACTLCDFIRRGLFALTVDRHPGRWFEVLWNKAAHWSWVQSLPKLMTNSSTPKAATHTDLE